MLSDAIQPLLDFRPSAAQSGANVGVPQAPAYPVPRHRVVRVHGASHAHTEDFRSNFAEFLSADAQPVSPGR